MTVSEVLIQGPDPEVDPEPGNDEIAGRSPMRIAMDRLLSDKVALLCAGIVLVYVLIAVFAPLLCRLFGVEVRAGDPVTDTDSFNYPVIGPPNYGFTWQAPLGLEPNSGNDLLAEWFYGARTSLIVATIATIVSTVVGVVLGLIAGYSRGWGDRVVTFVTDLFLTLPFLLVAIAVSPMLVERWKEKPAMLDSASLITLIVILSIFGWMGLARLIRGEVVSLREREFIEAAHVLGMPTHRILFKELLPNLVAPIVVSFSLSLPAVIAAEATLAYLGVGVTGRPSWGQTILRAQNWFDEYPLFLYAPIVGIVVLVFALNLLGDAIRDAFDPKSFR
ncbi:peptide/nickel transport system permease protein [Nocardioides albertanoniae]|uniref:Peptide/nickel transport system permease protein n=1 Tax=Nocardioides albertanoniae TaxID=1175486 RepID=A0A543A6U8_9ACTN|nr:ABC transporter permease [Nocardioides albertanoniae]TQL68297.1 peptide/nickel transport system permease protein [Nocardioides albertanoniae]